MFDQTEILKEKLQRTEKTEKKEKKEKSNLSDQTVFFQKISVARN